MPTTDRVRSRRLASLIAAGAAALLVAGCATDGVGATTQHGYIVSQTALAQIPVGSSRDQVLLALGTPSTTATFGGEVFYYISQTRRQRVQFLNPKVVDQEVVAVYFDGAHKVARVADYGLQDGVVFDAVSRTTPTGGNDLNFLQQIFAGIAGR